MVPERAVMPEATRAWMIDTLLGLLQTPSPSGRTDAVMQLIGDILDDLGVPFMLTRRGALTAELPGESKTTDRAVVVHADTIGCMVRDLKLQKMEGFELLASASCPTTTTSSSPEP